MGRICFRVGPKGGGEGRHERRPRRNRIGVPARDGNKGRAGRLRFDPRLLFRCDRRFEPTRPLLRDLRHRRHAVHRYIQVFRWANKCRHLLNVRHNGFNERRLPPGFLRCRIRKSLLRLFHTVVNRAIQVERKDGRGRPGFVGEPRNSLYQVFIEGGNSHGCESYT